MTTTANLFSQTTPTITKFQNSNEFLFKVTEMNAEITALNSNLGTNYPTFDTVTDNFEKFLHCLLTLVKLRELKNGNTGFNIKIGTISVSQGTWNGTTKNQRSFPVTMPFNTDLDVFGDSDNLG